MIVCRIPFCWVRIPSRIRCKHTHTYSTHTLHTLNTQRFLCVAALVQAMQCVQPLLRPTISPTSDFICLLYTPYTHPTHNLLYTPYTPYTQSALHTLHTICFTHPTHTLHKICCTHPTHTLHTICFTQPTHNLRTACPPHCSDTVGSVCSNSRVPCVQQFSRPTISPTSAFLTTYTYCTHSPCTHPTHTVHIATPPRRSTVAGSVKRGHSRILLSHPQQTF